MISDNRELSASAEISESNTFPDYRGDIRVEILRLYSLIDLRLKPAEVKKKKKKSYTYSPDRFPTKRGKKEMYYFAPTTSPLGLALQGKGHETSSSWPTDVGDIQPGGRV